MRRETEEFWWTHFFDDTYAEFELARTTDDDEKRREEAATFLVEALELQPGSTVLDQCCGVGRVSIPLARRGVRVVGVDLAESYVERARALAQSERLDCDFHVADAFHFVAPGPCDAAFNWFTSFGYHRDDRVNQGMLSSAFESLKPGGRFALDYVCVPRVLREFRAYPCAHRRSLADRDIWVVEEPSVDFVVGMFQTTWTFLHPDGRSETRQSENRTYLPNELLGLFHGAGFRDLELYGSTAREPFDRLSRRLIVVGQRPEQS